MSSDFLSLDSFNAAKIGIISGTCKYFGENLILFVQNNKARAISRALHRCCIEWWNED